MLSSEFSFARQAVTSLKIAVLNAFAQSIRDAGNKRACIRGGQ
jgi:hypothetical protein